MSLYPKKGIFCILIPQCIISVLVFLLGASLPYATAESDSVNILLFYEWDETVENFDGALKYIKNNPSLGLKVGGVTRVKSNGTDGTKLVQSLCKDVDYAFSYETKRPDIVLDFTRQGIPSEAVKLITKVMTLPTISGTFGQEGDIRSWRDLTENQKKFLIQVSPPADMVPQAVRSLVSQQDMTSAVLLFDREYEIQHKNKSLLQYMPTKHLFTKLEACPDKLRPQIDRLAHANMANFFIAAAPNEITDVLEQASDPQMKDGPYFGDEYAWYSMSMQPGRPSCAACQSNASVIHLSPKFRTRQNEKIQLLLTQKSLRSNMLQDLFYYDLTMSAISAVTKMKKDGSWIPPNKLVCKETEQAPPDTYTLDLFKAFSSDEVQKENLLGPFFFDSERTVGKSHANFQMDITRYTFKERSAEPVTTVPLGTWTTGFSEKDLIDSRGHDKYWKEHLARVKQAP